MGVLSLSEDQQQFCASIEEQVNQLEVRMRTMMTLYGTFLSATSVSTTAPVSVSAVPPPAHAIHGPLHLVKPECFSCDADRQQFPSERSNVTFIITHLSSRADVWAPVEWAQKFQVCHSLNRFMETLRNIFNHTSPGREAARVGLRQGKWRVFDHVIKFGHGQWLSEPFPAQHRPALSSTVFPIL